MGILMMEAMLRALVVSGSAAAMVLLLGAGTARRWTGVAMVIWLIPDLALSYGYREIFLPLIHWPALREFAYGTLLGIKSSALSIILLNAPFFGQSSTQQWLWGRTSPSLLWRWKRVRRGGLPRFILLALPSTWLCFHDFDLASRLGVPTWSVSLFDANAGGLPWRDTLAQSAPSLLISVSIVAMALYLGQKLPILPPAVEPAAKARSFKAAIIVLAVTAIMGYPLARIGLEASQGIALLAQQGSLLVDACLTLAWSGLAALGAILLCHHTPQRWLLPLLLPGMLGALPLGLGLVALGLTRWEVAGNFFPLALILGWTLWALPRACLLGWLESQMKPTPPVYLARSSGDPRLKWLYDGRALLLWLFPVWFFTYTEVLLAAMLAPPGFAPVFTRLYNLMHYGRGPLLSVLLVMSYGLVLLVQWIGIEIGNRIVKQNFDKS